MSEVYVLGCGGHSASRTFVPRSVTVHFHTVLDPPLSRSRSFSYSADAPADNDIPNYVLTQPGRVSFIEQFAGGAPAGSVYVVSGEAGYGAAVTVLIPVMDGLPLCTAPATCLEFWPVHGEGCWGIFRLLPEDVSEIHLVCLGPAARPSSEL